MLKKEVGIRFTADRLKMLQWAQSCSLGVGVRRGSFWRLGGGGGARGKLAHWAHVVLECIRQESFSSFRPRVMLVDLDLLLKGPRMMMPSVSTCTVGGCCCCFVEW